MVSWKIDMRGISHSFSPLTRVGKTIKAYIVSCTKENIYIDDKGVHRFVYKRKKKNIYIYINIYFVSILIGSITIY